MSKTYSLLFCSGSYCVAVVDDIWMGIWATRPLSLCSDFLQTTVQWNFGQWNIVGQKSNLVVEHLKNSCVNTLSPAFILSTFLQTGMQIQWLEKRQVCWIIIGSWGKTLGVQVLWSKSTMSALAFLISNFYIKDTWGLLYVCLF